MRGANNHTRLEELSLVMKSLSSEKYKYEPSSDEEAIRDDSEIM